MKVFYFEFGPQWLRQRGIYVWNSVFSEPARLHLGLVWPKCLCVRTREECVPRRRSFFHWIHTKNNNIYYVPINRTRARRVCIPRPINYVCVCLIIRQQLEEYAKGWWSECTSRVSVILTLGVPQHSSGQLGDLRNVYNVSFNRDQLL